MKGTIIKRGNKYSIVVDIGQDAFGKRKRRWISGFNSKKEAEKELPRILVKLQDGELLDYNNITLEKLSNDWLKGKIKKDGLSPTTIDGYENIIYNHIIPVIGTLKMQDIKPYNLQKYFDYKIETLSARTLKNHYRVMSSLFLYALDMEIISKNPLIKVSLPRQNKEEAKILTVEECTALLEQTNENLTLKMPVILSLLLGLRRGECLGLSWDNVDLENKRIKINQNLECVKGKYYFKEPKTPKSKRTIVIPDMLIPILKEHRVWQREMRLRSKGTWNNEYNLVCTRKLTGKPMRPTTLSDAFRLFLIRNELPQIRFHDLRHTNASLMLAAGVNVKAASIILGHSNTSITMDLYQHLLESVYVDAAEKINNLIAK